MAQVRAAVRLIAECAADYEVAHGLEDKLFEDVLRSIANGIRNAKELAAEALKSLELDFPRYGA